MPKVSVCIPTYNYGDFLGQAIESVLNQTFTDYELIICDDASTDNTEEIVKSYEDRRIKYFRNPTNIGLSRNYNKCIEKATGKYITTFDADDLMLPENLNEKVRILDSYPSVGLVHSHAYHINATGEVIGEQQKPKNIPIKSILKKGLIIKGGLPLFRRLITGNNFIVDSSVMVRRECYQTVGYYDPNLNFVSDWEMWMRISLEYDFAYIATPLVKYRFHIGQTTKQFEGKGRDLLEEFQAKKDVLERCKNKIEHYPNLRKKALYSSAIKSIGRAIGSYPHLALLYLFLAFRNCPQIVRSKTFLWFFVRYPKKLPSLIMKTIS